MDIKKILTETIKEYIEKYQLNSLKEINNGLCVDFAEDVASKCPLLEVVSLDTFLIDGWNCSPDDEWDEEGLELYHQQPIPIDFTKLKYHVFLYDGLKFYDAECTAGIYYFLELPIFKNLLF